MLFQRKAGEYQTKLIMSNLARNMAFAESINNRETWVIHSSFTSKFMDMLLRFLLFFFSHQKRSTKKVILKNSQKFTEKHLFFCDFCEIFKNIFFIKHLGTTASVLVTSLSFKTVCNYISHSTYSMVQCFIYLLFKIGTKIYSCLKTFWFDNKQTKYTLVECFIFILIKYTFSFSP